MNPTIDEPRPLFSACSNLNRLVNMSPRPSLCRKEELVKVRRVPSRDAAAHSHEGDLRVRLWQRSARQHTHKDRCPPPA
eukprot:5751159-Amphidinium_carterae.2